MEGVILYGFSTVCCLLCSTVTILNLPTSWVRRLPKYLRCLHLKGIVCARRFRELSVEGPFYKLFVWSGQKVGRGILSSKCRTPSIRVKATGSGEVQITISPKLPKFNPFHQETYILSWVPTSTPEQWHTKNVEPKGDCEKVGDGKLKTFIDALPQNKEIFVRVAANNYWGTDVWSESVVVETLRQPSDEWGATGPVIGFENLQYVWSQTRADVFIRIPVKPDVAASQLTVQCTGTKLTIRQTAEGSEQKTLLNGSLDKAVQADEMYWTIEEPSKKHCRHLLVQLPKAEALSKWKCLLQGHPKIDTNVIIWFTETSEPLHELNALSSAR